MKKINILALLVFLCVGSAFGQTPYNPFTQNIHFEPEPTAFGFECNTIQTVAFTQGLTTIDDATQWQTNPLTVVICLTGFTFNGPASTAVFGDYAANFDWAYDAFAPNCVVGTQNRTIVGTGSDIFNPNPAATGDIKVSLKVPETSPIGTVLAVNVNLQVPGYMAAFNSTPDDNESTQTQTFCPLKIKGNVYYDTTAANNTVDGPAIDSPNDTTLYAHLIDPSGNVVAVATIAPDGTYEFLNVTPNTTYTVLLSINQGTVGSIPPPVELPSSWINVNEDCCDRIGTDLVDDGKTSVVVNNATVLDVNFGIYSPTPLPLELNYFYVTENNCAALLSWSTLTEQNTMHVEVLRQDGIGQEFKKIATVKLAGNSSTTKMYSYIDREIVTKDEAYQYKLRFVDVDMKSSLSDIVPLKLNCQAGNNSVNIFPNPATADLNILYVTDVADAILAYDIVDVTGRTLISNTKSVETGSNIITINIESFAVGTYYVRYHEIDGVINGSVKFLKK